MELERGIKMEERRKNRRIDLESHLIMKSLNGDPKNAMIDITDVSKTGVGFESTQMLSIGTVYEAYLTIWTKEVLHAFLEIIRIEKVQGEDNKDGQLYNYGATFVGMPEMDASKISIYDVVSASQEKDAQEKK